MHKLVFTLILGLATLGLAAQSLPEPRCGTYGPEIDQLQWQRLQRNQAALARGEVNPGARTIQYIPIKFHLVAKTDGTGRVPETDVLDQLCELNEDFAPMDIQFFIKDGTFNYLNNSTLYTSHEGTINTVMTVQRNSRAVNVWVVNQIGDNEDGEILGYYSPFKDWLVVLRKEIAPGKTTLAHEMGHLLSLSHPHLGWDAVAYDPDVHGMPAPAMSPGGVATERADGSNCATAGDGICDTPADYNFGLGWPDCDYDGGALDPLGNPVDPEERLMMGYFLRCASSDYFFSQEQQNVMLADLASSGRNYLRIDPVPANSPISASPMPLQPANNATVDGFNQVVVSWEAVPGATAYVLELAWNNSFVVNPVRMVVYGTSKVVTGLVANRRYFWRVHPFNAHQVCQSPSPIFNFTTTDITANEEPGQVIGWEVAPNPSSRSLPLQVNLSSTEAFVADIAIYDLNGRQVYSLVNQRFHTGDNRLQLDLTGLSGGLYVLRMLTDAGQMTKKITLLD